MTSRQLCFLQPCSQTWKQSASLFILCKWYLIGEWHKGIIPNFRPCYCLVFRKAYGKWGRALCLVRDERQEKSVFITSFLISSGIEGTGKKEMYWRKKRLPSCIFIHYISVTRNYFWQTRNKPRAPSTVYYFLSDILIILCASTRASAPCTCTRMYWPCYMPARARPPGPGPIIKTGLLKGISWSSSRTHHGNPGSCVLRYRLTLFILHFARQDLPHFAL